MRKFPNHIRAAALSVAASAQWIANWVISTSFPVLKNVGLGLAYGLYATFAVLSFLFVWRFITETKGRELEDMGNEAARKIGSGPRRCGGALVIFSLALGAALGAAVVAQSDASPAPTSDAAPAPNNGKSVPQNRNPQTPSRPDVPNVAGLLGDFGNGDRSNLARHGFTLSGHLVTESAANLSGGLPLGGNAHQRGTAVSSEFGFGFDLDFNKLYAGSGAGIVHFLLTTRFGSNLSSQAIGNLASVEEIYGDGQTTRITFLDYEQPFAHKRLDLRLGKYNQQNDFIAGSTYWGGNLYCFLSEQ